MKRLYNPKPGADDESAPGLGIVETRHGTSLQGLFVIISLPQKLYGHRSLLGDSTTFSQLIHHFIETVVERAQLFPFLAMDAHGNLLPCAPHP